MTGRIATMSMDGTPISQADIKRIEDEERLHVEQKGKAARVVAATALDAEDCRVLLDILGLDREVMLAARRNRGSTTTASRRRIRAA